MITIGSVYRCTQMMYYAMEQWRRTLENWVLVRDCGPMKVRDYLWTQCQVKRRAPSAKLRTRTGMPADKSSCQGWRFLSMPRDHALLLVLESWFLKPNSRVTLLPDFDRKDAQGNLGTRWRRRCVKHRWANNSHQIQLWSMIRMTTLVAEFLHRL